MAALLRSETPDSMRALAIMYAEEQYRAWGNILHSVQTGEVGFEQQYGKSYFAYLAENPVADQVFNEAMTGWTMQLVGAVLEAYDFSPFKSVVDVGAATVRCSRRYCKIIRPQRASCSISHTFPPRRQNSWHRPTWRRVAQRSAEISSLRCHLARTRICLLRYSMIGMMSAV